MPGGRYSKLRYNLYFVNHLCDDDLDDELWKIKSLIDAMRKKCVTLPHIAHLSVDEQMIPFAGWCGFRHFGPSNPNPLGPKTFFLATNDGTVLDLCVYKKLVQGSTQNDISELELGGAVVKVLCATVPKDGFDVIYIVIDFFTSVKCSEFLVENKIYETVGSYCYEKWNWVGSFKLGDDKSLKRGRW
jgi:hypothetical protein